MEQMNIEPPVTSVAERLDRLYFELEKLQNQVAEVTLGLNSQSQKVQALDFTFKAEQSGIQAFHTVYANLENRVDQLETDVHNLKQTNTQNVTPSDPQTVDALRITVPLDYKRHTQTPCYTCAAL